MIDHPLLNSRTQAPAKQHGPNAPSLIRELEVAYSDIEAMQQQLQENQVLIIVEDLIMMVPSHAVIIRMHLCDHCVIY